MKKILLLLLVLALPLFGQSQAPFILTDSNGQLMWYDATNSDSAIVDITGNLFGVDSLLVGNYGKLTEVSAPGIPASGFGFIYAGTDGKLYFKNDAGTVSDLTAAAGSGAPTTSTYLTKTPDGSLSAEIAINSMTIADVATGDTLIYLDPNDSGNFKKGVVTLGGGGGSGTMTTVKEGGVQVGGADIVTLDFGAGIDISESPDTEVNFTLDFTEVAGHDNFTDFVANEHIDHTSVDITAGNGISGGGDISSTRTLNVDFSGTEFNQGTTWDANDRLAIWDNSASGMRYIVHSDWLSQMAAETQTLTNKSGSNSQWTNDAGYITATLTQEEVEDFAGALVATGGTKTGITVTYQDATGDMDFDVDHDAATNFVANEHIDWTNASSNFSTSGSATFAQADGIDVNPGSDIDADLVTVLVTGAPRFYWDESQTAFRFSTSVQTDGDVRVGSAGVLISDDGDGAITFLGLGNGFDEDLTFNFDDVSDEVTITSSTSLSNFNLSNIDLVADNVTSATGQVISGSTTQDGQYLIWDNDVGGDATITLQAPNALGTSYTLTLPPDDGTVSGHVLHTDGNGVLTWEADDGAGGGGAFSDAGDPAVLNTPSKDVAIGVTHINTAKLAIDNDADFPVLSLQENATQTDASFIIETSAGTEIMTVESGGLITSAVGFDAIGAVDMDYGSADVTDHTFTTDGSGDSEIVLPGQSISSTELLNDSIVDEDINSAAAISISKTALVAGTNITLSTNTLNVDDAFLVNSAADEAGGDIGFADGDGPEVGTNDDGKLFYDETDDILNITLTDGASVSTEDALVTIAIDSDNNEVETADQAIFEIGLNGANDTDASWAERLELDEDGDLSIAGSYSGVNVTSGADPGHTHTGASLSGIDISDDTNLTAGTNITLTGDDLSVDDAFVINSGSDVMAGTLTADGLTLGANENITLGAETLDHDGTDFVFSDAVNIGVNALVYGTGSLSNTDLELLDDGVITLTGAEVTGTLDLSDHVNLTAGANLTLTGDEVSLSTTLDLGGSTLEIPNANDPTTTNEGQIAFDANNHAIEATDGTDDFLIATKLKTFSATIYDPEGVQTNIDNIPILAVEAEAFPFGITLVDVGIKTSASSTYSINFEEWTSPTDGAPSTIETVATSASTEAEDDGTLSDAAIAAGSIIMVDLPTTAEDWVQVWGTFYINDGN